MHLALPTGRQNLDTDGLRRSIEPPSLQPLYIPRNSEERGQFDQARVSVCLELEERESERKRDKQYQSARGIRETMVDGETELARESQAGQRGNQNRST